VGVAFSLLFTVLTDSLGGSVVENYEKEIKEFSERLENNEAKVEFISNDGQNYSDKENRDFIAYTEYLKSDACKSLADKVFGNGNIS